MAADPDTGRHGTGSPAGPRPEARLQDLLKRSRLALIWERLWPRLWLPLAVVFVFLTASWLGLWSLIAPQWRWLGLTLFGLAFVAAIIPLVRLKVPGRAEAAARLDRGAPDGHRPTAALFDQLAVGQRDPVTEALWRIHRERQERAIETLQVKPPAPGMVRLDRHALRAAPIVAAVAAFFVAGPEAGDRLKQAFDWRTAQPPGPALRIDGWIDPPGYTRLPPVMLTFAGQDGPVRAPERSVVIVRIAGAPAATVEVSGGLEPEPTPAGVRAGIERRFRLHGDGVVRISGNGVPASEARIESVSDRAPTIEMTEAPQAGQRGQLTVTYRAQDDYGVASVEAGFQPLETARKPGSRPLIEPPRLPLPAPTGAEGEADSRATLELAEHPWAGARVRMTLTARDDAGQEATSEARDVTLPQRSFVKPLARALVETRRWLVLDVTERPRVQTALDALMIEPGEYSEGLGDYLAIRAVTEKLRGAPQGPRGDDTLRQVVDDLWQIALMLEDGDLSDAERQLRQAQDRLQQALERGAEQDEISRLTRELREAMDRFMRELAEQMQRDQQNGRENETARAPENQRTVTPRDLNNMLNRIEELNRRGETEEAQRLLNELNNILRNLQMARPGQQDPRQREMQQQLSELDRLTRDQQELRDETFQEGQEQRAQRQQQQRPGQRGQQQARPQQGPGQQGQQQRGQQGRQGQQPGEQPGGEGQQAEGQDGQGASPGGRQSDRLGQRQQQLRDRLGELQRRMRGQGSAGQQALQDAERAMGEAEGALGQGDMPGAGEAQGRALDALRNGAQQLAQQMQQEGEGSGEGEGMADGDPQPGGRDRAGSRQGQQRDPLGREGNQRETSRGIVSGDTRVPGEAAQVRARRILEELRRRLGETMRPQEELEYLERLLRRQ